MENKGYQIEKVTSLFYSNWFKVKEEMISDRKSNMALFIEIGQNEERKGYPIGKATWHLLFKLVQNEQRKGYQIAKVFKLVRSEKQKDIR